MAADSFLRSSQTKPAASISSYYRFLRAARRVLDPGFLWSLYKVIMKYLSYCRGLVWYGMVNDVGRITKKDRKD